MSWISLKSQLAIASGHMNFPPKELAADQCYYTFDPPNSTISQAPTEEFHSLYKISYMWYTMVGALFTGFVSLICSLYYGFNDPTTISPDLITPVLRKRIFKNHQKGRQTSVIREVKDTEF